ncbi:MAG: endonuclease MutS2 [Clostridia bacterium]|nr:endonuclease MutS2 [Clostridia bacterium]
MNTRALQTLEFNKIQQMLYEHTASNMGRTEAEKLRPSSDMEDVNRMLTETEEAVMILRSTGRTPVDGFPDIRDMLQRIHATLALSARELLQVAQCLRVCRNAGDVLRDSASAMLLKQLAERLPSHRMVEEKIQSCILSEDEIADNASSELARIRRQMKLANEKVREKLNQMIRSAAFQKYLQEPIITVRDGRYALPVKAEYRAQVPGLIHDTSGSGATLFIEPSVAVDLGNEYKRLQGEEAREIERILANLTAYVDPVAPDLITGLEVLAKLDLVFAKAYLAGEMNGVRPNVNEDGKVSILKGIHPLLNRDTAVPVDIWLGEEFSTLIITGPNTGGKTVTLKTLGLLTLMTMSGMFIPAETGSKVSLFEEVYADIGDEQSIEQSLSTFSSHMKNTVHILKNADSRSLVLLDELGAGTDPVEGAALAQAILEKLYNCGAKTVATTHYSEIKAFAMTHSGMQNASMEFDVDRLCPTYHLHIGIPGKSNAFEISRRLGLDAAVIERANEYLRKQDIAFENVIAGAEAARREAEEYREKARLTHEEAEKIRNAAEKEREKLIRERDKWRDQAKEESRRLIRDTKREMETVIAQLRTAGKGSAAVERAIQNARDAVREREGILAMGEKALDQDTGSVPSSVLPGQEVLVASVNQDATVLKEPDAKGEVLVQAGMIKLKVPMSDLRIIETQKQNRKSTSSSFKTALHDSERSFLELDLRGKTVDEAIVEIDRFIDDAEMAGIGQISLIHGKGTGALRAGVQTYLKSHPRVKTYRIGAYGEGDAGVTVVTLKQK